MLLLANPFKGALSSKELVKTASALGIHCVSVSDGGDGLLDAFSLFYPTSKLYRTPARDAYGKIKKAPFLLINKKICVIESARVAGLGAGDIKKKKLPVMQTSSHGLGEVIKKAAALGAKEFYIGLGGVACNDGGAGMAEALGAKFLDGTAKEILINTGNISKIKNINITALDRYKSIKFYALTDVKNPLLGPKGSARIFGPQKGANAKEVAQIEDGLKNLSSFFPAYYKKEPGGAAAGALGFGLSAFLGAQITPGAQFIFEKLDIEKEIKKAKKIILTEGKLDAQTFMGKAPGAAAALAKKYKKEVHFICGVSELTPAQARKKGIGRLHPFLNAPYGKEEITASIKNSKKLLKEKLRTLYEDKKY